MLDYFIYKGFINGNEIKVQVIDFFREKNKISIN